MWLRALGESASRYADFPCKGGERLYVAVVFSYLLGEDTALPIVLFSPLLGVVSLLWEVRVFCGNR